MRRIIAMKITEYFSSRVLAKSARKSLRHVDRAIAAGALVPDAVLRGAKRDAALWLPGSIEKTRVALSAKQPRRIK